MQRISRCPDRAEIVATVALFPPLTLSAKGHGHGLVQQPGALHRLMDAMRRLVVLTMVLAVSAGVLLAPTTAFAQNSSLGASNLPLPRFVSLKATRVNLRVGPGRDYSIAWRYTKSGLPMEITQEYDNWRRVRDVDGTEGWILGSLLSGERAAIVSPWKRSMAKDNLISLMRAPAADSRIVARLEPGVILDIRACNGTWCEAEVAGVTGWVEQNALWGVYPGEAFK